MRGRSGGVVYAPIVSLGVGVERAKVRREIRKERADRIDDAGQT